MSSPASPPPTHPVGAVISARVQRLRDYGAEVTLDDGSSGIIRNRELVWEDEPVDPGEILQPGQEIKAMVVKFDRRRGRYELSLRQAERDPWKDLHLRYRVGEPARGKVVALQPRGAVVELEPAVKAFVGIEQIRPTPPPRIEDALWIGDVVEGIVEEIKPQQRRISLNLRRRQEQLQAIEHQARDRLEAEVQSHRGVTLSDALDPATREQLLLLLDRVRSDDPSDKQACRPGLSRVPGIASVLIADDDPAFRGALERLLRFIGYEVVTAGTAERAVELATVRPFDLVLMDLGFAGNGLRGIDAVARILRSKPDTPVLVITGIAWLERNSDEVQQARDLGARSALLKPVLFARLETLMRAIAEDRDGWALADVPIDPARAEAGQDNSPWTSVTATSVERTIAGQLHSLRTATGASAVTLFHVTSAGDVPPVRASVGAPLRDLDQAKYTLADSPIRNVMVTASPLLIPDTGQNPEQVRHLQLLPFACCLGVPVPALGPLEYALFAFHSRPGGLTADCIPLATAAATAIGAALAREEAERIMQRAQPLITIGQLSSALIHELNSAIGAVSSGVEQLHQGWERLHGEPGSALDPQLSSDMRQATTASLDGIQRMVGLVNRYLDPRRAQQRAPVNVNDVVTAALRVLEPKAATSNVRLLTDLAPNMPRTMTLANRLEQVFINVGLNAVQQMDEYRKQGVLRVRTSLHSGGATSTIHVQFADNGPGIHTQNVARLGELGFTTRSDGTGLGLFIARGLLESLGGKLRLADSVMFLGTTFVVELPLVIPSV